MRDLVKINEEGWYWPIGDAGSWEIQRSQVDLFNRTIKPFLTKMGVMVQAGGNCGLILSTFVPHFEHIYTFEPDPVNFYCLCLNVDSPKVTKIQACLGDSNDLVGIDNYLQDIGAVHVKGKGYTPMMKIDDLHLTSCDLIQLDVEGYELEALYGAMETIHLFGPVICVEVWSEWLNRYGVSEESLDNFFKNNIGYECVNSQNVDRVYRLKE